MIMLVEGNKYDFMTLIRELLSVSSFNWVTLAFFKHGMLTKRPQGELREPSLAPIMSHSTIKVSTNLLNEPRILAWCTFNAA